jgi:ribosomal protein L10
MPNLEAKQQIVQALREKLTNSKSVVLTDYRGLKVSEITQLRAELRKAGVEFRVVKNTITGFAIQGIGLEGLEAHLKGPTAIAFGIEDPVAPAKILADFAKTHKNLKIKAGVVEGWRKLWGCFKLRLRVGSMYSKLRLEVWLAYWTVCANKKKKQLRLNCRIIKETMINRTIQGTHY